MEEPGAKPNSLASKPQLSSPVQDFDPLIKVESSDAKGKHALFFSTNPMLSDFKQQLLSAPGCNDWL